MCVIKPPHLSPDQVRGRKRSQTEAAGLVSVGLESKASGCSLRPCDQSYKRKCDPGSGVSIPGRSSWRVSATEGAATAPHQLPESDKPSAKYGDLFKCGCCYHPSQTVVSPGSTASCAFWGSHSKESAGCVCTLGKRPRGYTCVTF